MALLWAVVSLMQRVLGSVCVLGYCCCLFCFFSSPPPLPSKPVLFYYSSARHGAISPCSKTDRAAAEEGVRRIVTRKQPLLQSSRESTPGDNGIHFQRERETGCGNEPRRSALLRIKDTRTRTSSLSPSLSCLFSFSSFRGCKARYAAVK